MWYWAAAFLCYLNFKSLNNMWRNPGWLSHNHTSCNCLLHTVCHDSHDPEWRCICSSCLPCKSERVSTDKHQPFESTHKISPLKRQKIAYHIEIIQWCLPLCLQHLCVFMHKLLCQKNWFEQCCAATNEHGCWQFCFNMFGFENSSILSIIINLV